MAVWWKLADGNYINSDNLKSVYSYNAGGGNWKLQVEDDDGGSPDLDGVWSSEADADAAMRRLTGGLNAADYGDAD